MIVYIKVISESILASFMCIIALWFIVCIKSLIEDRWINSVGVSNCAGRRNYHG